MPDDSVAALGKTPIAGPSPAGASARYEPEFEKLAGEIAKLESVEGRASIRWEDVVSLSTSLLSSKSKDLLVAGYLVLGLCRKQGYAGLAAGLQVCRDMIATFWDGLFPEKNRLRARSAALQWMAERVGAAVREMRAPSRSDGEILTSCTTLIEELSSLVGDRFPEEGPDLGELRRAVQEKLEAIPSEAPAAPEEAEGETPAAVEAAAPVPLGPIGSADEARQALTGPCRQLLEIAEALRKIRPTDPLSYRLLRLALWADLVEAPPSADGVTQLSGGDPAFAAEQEKRLDAGEYDAVIADCEARFPSDPWWLDLHFFVIRAMEGLGRPYAAARKVVENMVAGAVRSVPSLVDLKFADGTPLAGEAARLWVLNELGALPGKGGVGGGGGRPTEAVLPEARKLAARKEFDRAAALMQKAMQGATSRRDRFAARLDMAKLCLEGGRADLARPLLEALDEESRAFPLEEWEPDLCVELCTELVKCHSTLSSPEKAEEAYGRLCRLDLAAALALKAKR